MLKRRARQEASPEPRHGRRGEADLQGHWGSHEAIVGSGLLLTINNDKNDNN